MVGSANFLMLGNEYRVNNNCCFNCLIIYSESKFKRSDAFIGFQKDTPASVIFQASNLLRSATSAVRAGGNATDWERVFQWCKLEHESWDIEEELDPNIWQGAVSFIVSLRHASRHT